jgi:putative transposase
VRGLDRRVDQLVERLGLRISKSDVSRVREALDEHVQAFRTRPLEGRYPYLFLDAKVEKVLDGGRVVNKALVIAHGIHETGRREIVSIDVGEAETEPFWTEFLRGLVKRGLTGVQLAISDAHAGLKAAIAKVLGCAWLSNATKAHHADGEGAAPGRKQTPSSRACL